MIHTLIVTSMLFTAETTCPAIEPFNEPVGVYEREASSLAQTVETERDRAAQIALIEHYEALGKHKEGLKLIEPLLVETPNDRRLQRLRNQLSLQRLNNAGVFSVIGAAKKMRDGCAADHRADPANTHAVLCLARFHGNAPGIAGGDKDTRDRLVAELEESDEARYLIARATAGFDLSAGERVDALTRSIALDDRVDTRLALAALHMEQKNWPDARDAFRQIIDRAGNTPLGHAARYQLGRLMTFDGASNDEQQEGLAALTAFLEGRTWFGGENLRANAHALMGEIYEQQDCLPAALAANERALTHDKKNKQAKKAVKALEKKIKAQKRAGR